MAILLYRVGRFAYSHRAVVIGVWLLLLLSAAASTAFAKPFVTSFDLPGTESARAATMLATKFPGQGDLQMQAQAKVVMQAPAGTTLDRSQNMSRVDRLVAGLRGLDHVVAPHSIVNPLRTPALTTQVSADRTIAYVDVVYDQKFVDVDASEVDAFNALLRQARDAGLRVEATGRS